MNDNDLPDYVDELDRLLLDQPDECMLLTQLDGFLAGIIVSPDLVPSSQWLRQVWIGEDGQGMPEFPDLAGFQHMLDLVMMHYNAIIAALAMPGSYQPLFDIDLCNDDVLWELWIEGFTKAMAMAPTGWQRITASADHACKAALAGMAKLRAIADGTSRLSASKEAQWTREAPDLIPIWVEALHRWRLANDSDVPVSQGTSRGKVGRNEPCPCGSGRKYKKCCGLN